MGTTIKYPVIRINGKKQEVEKKIFDWYVSQISSSISHDNQENDLGLTKSDIELLSWNAAVMVYHEHLTNRILGNAMVKLP